jgi:spore coat protein CotF
MDVNSCGQKEVTGTVAGFTMTTKEQTLLNEVLSQEKLCMAKYQAYSNQLQDPTLKGMFQQMATKEQEHLSSITQLFTQAGLSPSSQ